MLPTARWNSFITKGQVAKQTTTVYTEKFLIVYSMHFFFICREICNIARNLLFSKYTQKIKDQKLINIFNKLLLYKTNSFIPGFHLVYINTKVIT